MSTPQPEAGASDEFSLLDLATVLAANLKAIVGLPVLVGILAFGASYLITPTFTATAQILAPAQQQSTAAAMLGSLGGLSGLAGGALGGLKNPADQWIGFAKSETISDALIGRFKLRERYDAEYQFQARKKLDQNVRVVAGKDGLIDIEVDDEQPETAAKMANALIEELQKLSNTLAVGEAGQRRLFFERQLEAAKTKLTQAEIALKGSGISESVIKTSPDAAVAIVAQIKALVSASEVRLQVMRSRMAEGTPEIQQAQQELSSLRQQLAQAERADPDGGKGKGAEYVTRYREFKYYETLFEMMARQYELAKADEAREGAVIQVVDPAKVPEWKSKPKRATLAAGAAALTFILVLIYTLSANAIRNVKADPASTAKWERLMRGLGRSA